MNPAQLLVYVSQYLPDELRLMQAGAYATACPELSAAEKAVVYHYTHTGSQAVNQALYASNGNNDTLFGQALAAALHKLPPFAGQQVFSAAWLTLAQWQQVRAAADGRTLVDAAPLSWPAFLSTSRSPRIAEQHLNYPPKNCLFSIQSRTGRLVEALSYYGPHGPDPGLNEREVLFLPNTQFAVIGIDSATPLPEIGLVEL